MQDPRFCSACGAGPFTYMQNHTNKCKEAKRQELEFMNSIRNAKPLSPEFKREIQKRREPPEFTPQDTSKPTSNN